MTEQELAAIEARHQPERAYCGWHHARGDHTDACQPLICVDCSSDDCQVAWPCDAARLLDHIRAVSR